MVFSNCLLCPFLAVLATQAVSPPTNAQSDASCPQPGLLVEKLVNLSTALNNINDSLLYVFDLINQQCPCLDSSPDCFETRVSNFRTALEELIDDTDNVTDRAPSDCPDRTGAVFVATCDGTDVAVVDPNGVIQNGFSTGTNVTAWAVYLNGNTYGIDYFRNDPFQVRCRPTPNEVEVVLGEVGDGPITMPAVGRGIFFDPDTGNDYVAITFDDTTLNGIYCFNRTVFPVITLLFHFNGDIGRTKLDGGFVYIINGQRIVRRRLDGTDDGWAEVLFFSTDIKDFDVLDNGQVVFTDTSGAVWLFDPVQQTYRQLKRPPNNGICGASSAINPCDSLLYVANINDPDLEIYNATSFQRVGSLTYTDSTPSPCPSVGFDPSFCCA
ncbi:uncharacterized protein [Haliotis asinina]|uniref:uncharacterized protein n=1 Tax=Haliotis asinina TaxID=109174 RepID=UPI00353202D0